LSSHDFNKLQKYADMHSALAFATGDSDALRSLIESPKGPAADILTPIARGFDLLAILGAAFPTRSPRHPKQDDLGLALAPDPSHLNPRGPMARLDWSYVLSVGGTLAITARAIIMLFAM
jgi:hypothetical protein